MRPHRQQPTRFPIPGILQARILEWVAISFSNAWKWKMKVKLLSRVQLLATPWTAAYQGPLSMRFSRQEYCHLNKCSLYWTNTRKEGLYLDILHLLTQLYNIYAQTSLLCMVSHTKQCHLNCLREQESPCQVYKCFSITFFKEVVHIVFKFQLSNSL